MYLVIGCFCGGFNSWCRLDETLEKYLIVDQSLPFGSLQYYRMALGVLGSAGYGPIHAP